METISQKIIRMAPLFETFRVIHKQGSLTAAADELQLGKSIISKRLNQLEKQLGVTLFERSTRKLHLTGAGKQLLSHTDLIFGQFQEALIAMEKWQTTVTGKLRLTAANILSKDAIQICKIYREQYPGVLVTLHIDDEKKNLPAENYDLGLRFGSTENERLVEHCFLRQVSQAIVLRSDAFDTNGISLDTLHTLPWAVPELDIVDFRRWRLCNEAGQFAYLQYKPTYTCQQSQQIYDLLYAGMAVVIWPRHQVAEDIASNLLTELLPEWQLPYQKAYAMYPSAAGLSQNARIWLHLAEAYFREQAVG